MLDEVFQGNNQPIAREELSDSESWVLEWMRQRLEPYPVYRLRLRKGFSNDAAMVSLDVNLDPTLSSRTLFRTMAENMGRDLGIEFTPVVEMSRRSPFGYFFYGDGLIGDFQVRVFVDCAGAER